jgi:microsomal dipeptidase-like Zn-dependent dipeptidase
LCLTKLLALAACLGGSRDLNAMLDHIDHLKKTVGAEHIAIGTDVFYHSRFEEADENALG